MEVAQDGRQVLDSYGTKRSYAHSSNNLIRLAGDRLVSTRPPDDGATNDEVASDVGLIGDECFNADMGGEKESTAHQ